MDFQCENNLEELHEKISVQFEIFKEKLNSKEHLNLNQLLYNMTVESDNLQYKIKYETEKYVNRDLQNKEKNSFLFDDASILNMKKCEYLIKLQTLSSMLTCHIMNDYKKLVQDKECQKF